MDLIKYDDLSDFVLDLIQFSILEESDASIFLKEIGDDKVKVVFADNEKGVFFCCIWIKNIKTAKEYEVIEAITDAWAYYCNLTDADVVELIRVCSILSCSILKGLR
jgi:hypothetical protein